MSERFDSRETAELSASRPKPSRLRRGILLTIGLSVIGGLSFSLVSSIQRAREAAARMR